MTDYNVAGQMDIFDLFDTGFGMSTDEKIIKYLFDTKEVCSICGWYSDLKAAFYQGKDFVTEVANVFSECDEWSNVIFKNHTDLDFSELDHKRVGVQYSKGGIKINYDGAYLEKSKWKYITLSYKKVAEIISNMFLGESS